MINTLLMLANLVGHAVTGVFLVNTRLIGVRDGPYKSPLILLNLTGWPLLGLVQALRAGGSSRYALSLLQPFSRGWLWRVFFTFLGARWIAQEVYRRRHPAPRPYELVSTHVRDTGMRSEIIEAEGLQTTGVRGIFNKINEIYSLQVVTHEVRLARLPTEFDGFTILQISDIHYGHFTSAEFVRRFVGMGLALSPDLVALTGDYQTYSKDIETIADLLAPVGDWAGGGPEKALAVLGNHDTWTGTASVTHALRGSGIRVLNNGHVRLQRNGASLYIAGVADPWSLRADLARALEGIPPESCIILLAHVPDFLIEAAERGIDLQLSGHNHGGQIKVPLIGPVLVSSRYGRRYASGFHKREDTLMYASNGLGGHPPVRWGSKPEITLFILRA